jgi:hypothetical protein
VVRGKEEEPNDKKQGEKLSAMSNQLSAEGMNESLKVEAISFEFDA